MCGSYEFKRTYPAGVVEGLEARDFEAANLSVFRLSEPGVDGAIGLDDRGT